MVKYKHLSKPIRKFIVDPISLVAKRHILTNDVLSYEYLHYEINRVLKDHGYMVKGYDVTIHNNHIEVHLDIKYGATFEMIIEKK